MHKIIVIVGPTAVGKSTLSIQIAKKFNGEIINGDSVQVYKELNIGSAKITAEQMEGIDHHLLDYLDVSEDYNVARFQNDGRKAIEEIVAKNKVPIIVGGTGLYIKALIYDYNFAKNVEVDTSKYDDLTNEQLYEMLKKVDYVSSLKIHPNNRKRVIRALIIAESGQTKSEQEANQKHETIYDALLLGLTMDKEKLNDRINKRVDMMIDEGLEKEITYLFDKYPIDSHPFSAIGYKEMIPYYKKQASLEDCVNQIKVHTRQFAKRQYTWFKNQMDINWYDIENSDYPNNIFDQVERFINNE